MEEPHPKFDAEEIGDGSYVEEEPQVGVTGFVDLRDVRSGFAKGKREEAQEKLMRCVYYATGNMLGVQKLYEAIRSVDIDKDKGQLRVGDYVRLDPIYRVKGVAQNDKRYIIALRNDDNEQEQTKEQLRPVTAGGSVKTGSLVRIAGGAFYHVLTVTKLLANGEYSFKRKIDDKKIKTLHRRDEVRLVHGITRDMVKDFLMRQKVYQLSRRPKRTKRNARAFVPNGRRSVIQIDLIGPMTKEGVCDKRHALVAIDVFTRKAFTRSLKSTSAGPAGKAFVDVLEEMKKGNAFEDVKRNKAKKRVVIVSYDGGSEFKAGFWAKVDEWVQKQSDVGIQVKQVIGIPGVPTSQAYVERTNQSIKGLLYKMLHTHKRKCFSSFLQRATQVYNDTVHATIKMTPNQAEGEDRETVRRNIHKTLRRKHQATSAQMKRDELQVGDYVRILQRKSAIDHRYYSNWREPIFRVAKVVVPRSMNDVLRYELEASNAKDARLIQGATEENFRYKRNMLLHVPSNEAVEPPADMSTFKKWCKACKEDCLDYDAFVKAAKEQKQEEQKKKTKEDEKKAKKKKREQKKLGATKGFQEASKSVTIPKQKTGDVARKSSRLAKQKGTPRKKKQGKKS